MLLFLVYLKPLFFNVSNDCSINVCFFMTYPSKSKWLRSTHSRVWYNKHKKNASEVLSMTSDSTEIVTFCHLRLCWRNCDKTSASYYGSVSYRWVQPIPQNVRDRWKTLRQALQDALEEKALVLHTLINQELIEITRSFVKNINYLVLMWWRHRYQKLNV